VREVSQRKLARALTPQQEATLKSHKAQVIPSFSHCEAQM
jgi:Spy/CpxP family protein refolding chaperone